MERTKRKVDEPRVAQRVPYPQTSNHSEQSCSLAEPQATSRRKGQSDVSRTYGSDDQLDTQANECRTTSRGPAPSRFTNRWVARRWAQEPILLRSLERKIRRMSRGPAGWSRRRRKDARSEARGIERTGTFGDLSDEVYDGKYGQERYVGHSDALQSTQRRT